MSSQQRVSLIDPMLYQSSYINPNPPKPIKLNFWKKFNVYSFLCNIAIPIIVIIFVLFVLKDKYLSKKRQDAEKNMNTKRLSSFKSMAS